MPVVVLKKKFMKIYLGISAFELLQQPKKTSNAKLFLHM